MWKRWSSIDRGLLITVDFGDAPSDWTKPFSQDLTVEIFRNGLQLNHSKRVSMTGHMGRGGIYREHEAGFVLVHCFAGLGGGGELLHTAGLARQDTLVRSQRG